MSPRRSPASPPRWERGGDHVRIQLPFAKCGCQTIAPGPPPECSVGPYDPVLVTRERTRFVIHSRPVRVWPGDESPSGPSLPICPRDPLLNIIVSGLWLALRLHLLADLTSPEREALDALSRLHIDRSVLWRRCSQRHPWTCPSPLTACPSYLSRARECSSYGELHALL